MSLSDFKKFIQPGAIKFYINADGFITCDRIYHESLFKFFIVTNWSRFSEVVSSKALYQTILDIRHSSLLRFNINDEYDLYDPPECIAKLLRLEKRHALVGVLLKSRGFISTLALYIFSIILIVCVGVEALSFKEKVITKALGDLSWM